MATRARQRQGLEACQAQRSCPLLCHTPTHLSMNRACSSRCEKVLLASASSVRSSDTCSLPSLLASYFSNSSSARSSALGWSMVAASPRMKMEPSEPLARRWSSVRMDLRVGGSGGG
jgi:hypothetical protein